MIIKILEQDVNTEHLNHDELLYLNQFVDQKTLSLEELWQLMAQAWENLGAGYTENHQEAVAKFYASPVWLLNGIFTEWDPQSKQHREKIAEWVANIRPNLVVDFGGGYGSLGRKIAANCPNTDVKIVEPYPRKAALALAEQYTNLEYVAQLPKNIDVLIAQDVLEHVLDPLATFYTLLEAVRVGGYVITANCFYPVIKCHLPVNFHFRYTFALIVTQLGCDYLGTLPGVNHAQIFF
ncbi:MAG: class I SAM-dependent methyltransferase [Oscillatoriaceae bacterium SKW80]|nr:class I SAM-dependent methyltransferase [Oscillatoriaceae bacterium SKYG93]MCX8120893.1 class I SAM-dependent methyltransferase [Oscillatoriaceae bacterium SKW80]MDW8452166.1 methyltransferase domain-containing protein [Oscillatoriaceae cyanobacterium SKYGB_i_bin93]